MAVERVSQCPYRLAEDQCRFLALLGPPFQSIGCLLLEQIEK
jgi:hypothetical protein